MTFRAPAVAVVAALALLAVTGASPALGGRSDVPNWPYTVYRPANLSKATPVPLVVFPAYGDLQAARTSTNLEAAADRFGFVLVWAQILKSYNDVVHASGEDPAHPYPDMLDLGNVIDQVEASENIDPNRVFMTGISAAGTLSYRAACVLADKLAGIAPVEAVVVNPSCRPSRPVSLFAINGTADPASPYNGGLGFPSVAAVMASWRGYDSCPSNATTKTISSTTTLTTWAPCQGGTAVQLATVNGGGHGWPGVNGIARFDGATLIGSVLMSLHAASSQPAASLSAKFVSVVVDAGKPRTVVVSLSSNLAASGRATLALTTGKTVYTHVVQAKIGASTFRFALPARIRKGTYRLTVSLKAGGGTVTMHRTVRVPR